MVDTSVLSACEGLPFSVSAKAWLPGSSPLYQWYRNGTLLPQETGNTLNLPGILATDSLKVRLISNAPCRMGGSDTVFSASRTFTIQPTVLTVVSLLTNQPTDGICPGQPIRFAANGLHTGPGPVYLWFVNDSLQISGADTVFVLSHPDRQDSIRVEMQSDALCANPGTVTSVAFHPHIFDSPDLTILVNQNELSVPGNAGWEFQWMKNGLPIAGATDSVLVISDSGHYSVALLSPDQCADTTGQVFALFTFVKNQKATGIRLYPNPVSRNLHLESAEMPLRIEVQDALGRTLHACPEPVSVLDVSFLPPGYYTLKIWRIEGVTRMGFVKER